ncbi:Metal transporter Nramp5 [Acorus calamus]|uniref:Metal transporter Nramp5 n=1 Tax=Acorus calamus TaxID=4465 RepID=A0AAV9FD22_ACOCL|nr:Metal transporter Nramp5 [Acorus calamus]
MRGSNYKRVDAQLRGMRTTIETWVEKVYGPCGPGFLVSLAYLDPGNWKHLAELCKAEYPKFVKYCLWLLAEVAVIAADIPEVIGTAFALNILFHIPLWGGVLITGLSTLMLLGLQRYGVRKLELLISVLVFVMAGCYFGELSYVKPPTSQVIRGLFIPKLKRPGSHRGCNCSLGRPCHASACRHFLLESRFALFVALLINIEVISVSRTGFLDLRMKTWLRNLMTRCIAIAPSLIVTIIGGSAGSGRLIIIASIINISWILGLCIIGINIYYLSTGFVDWLIHNSLPVVGNVFVGIIVFPIMAIYIIFVIYLMFRKDRTVMFIDTSVESNQIEMKKGAEERTIDHVPYREDLAYIPLPQ